ncbi:methyltransferase domain-containing protein [Sphingobium cupriresistens]|uniref:methyltransferase domain-containing protein n=1 Tax=Sphingobium cupriresistens TaxID=1132417 RepID=UPI003BADD309
MNMDQGAIEPSGTPSQNLRRPTLLDVARGYRMFLGRELEGAAIAGFHISKSPDLWNLIETIWSCQEAQNRRLVASMETAQRYQESDILTLETSHEQLDQLYQITLEAWRLRGLGSYREELRRNTARFSGRSGRWNCAHTLEAGRSELQHLTKALSRFGWEAVQGLTITALGPESFRLLQGTEDIDARLIGFELLTTDLAGANQTQLESGHSSANFHPIADFREHADIADLFYSIGGLQYAPPPVAIDIVRHAVSCLKPGGIAVFQIPTFLHDYSFDAVEYLAGKGQTLTGELHAVPQHAVLNLLATEGMQVLEVVPDASIGIHGLSYLYFARKNSDFDAGRASASETRRLTNEKDDHVEQTLTNDDLEHSIQNRQWFHRIDLGNGVITPGMDDTPFKLPALVLPDDLSGKTVLDVGAWDGFFSFECERRGAARVVASDSYCWDGEDIQDGGGFRLAHAALNSRVERLNVSVEQLDSAIHGTFDYVLFLGVLYHARDPLGYLAKMRSLCREVTVIETWVDGLDIDRPAMIFYPGGALNNDASNYFGPNESAVIAMCKEVGFSEVEVVNRHYYPNRMVFHARV